MWQRPNRRWGIFSARQHYAERRLSENLEIQLAHFYVFHIISAYAT